MATRLKSGRVQLIFHELCGFLDEVTFDGRFSPLHTAHWAGRDDLNDLPPMLKNLRGDFFCAPFGAADADPAETRPHGASANDIWEPVEILDQKGQWKLRPEICGATLFKHIELVPDHPIVYQKHVFKGGRGKLPVAHHLMLKARSGLQLSFSGYRYIATPPDPVEVDPAMGKSLLAYNTRFSKLEQTPLADGRTLDLSVYPLPEPHEDLLMLSSGPGILPAWSAAVCRDENWIWFALKDASVLPSTTLWMSNGGRYYPPFNGTHKRVIGIEECRSYFHLGHRASVAPNPVSDAGIPTSLDLNGDTTEIRYAFGVVERPQNLEKVGDIRFSGESLELSGNGIAINIPFNTNFFNE